MKILISGSTGFIGGYVYKNLMMTDHQIYGFSRRAIGHRPDFYQADILQHQLIKKHLSVLKPDVLIHLAWDVAHGEFWHAQNNLEYAKASMRLFDSFIECGGKKIIAAGTCAEYPTLSEPVVENKDYAESISLYGQAKKTVYQYLEELHQKSLVDFTWFRVFGVYGHGENPKRFFPSAIHAIKNKFNYPIENPNSFFDYIYVDDLACFVAACIDREGVGAVNMGTGNSKSIADVFSMIKYYVEHKVYKNFQDVTEPGNHSRIPNCDKLHQLGFKFELNRGFDSLMR